MQMQTSLNAPSSVYKKLYREMLHCSMLCHSSIKIYAIYLIMQCPDLDREVEFNFIDVTILVFTR